MSRKKFSDGRLSRQARRAMFSAPRYSVLLGPPLCPVRPAALHYPFAAPGDLGLRALMIDGPAQGAGLGKAAMSALHGYLPPLYPDTQVIWLTVNFKNPAARSVYLKSGFTETGEIWRGGKNGPQHVMRLALRR